MSLRPAVVDADPFGDVPELLHGFRAIHLAMRRDVRRLARTARVVAGPPRARRLATWYDHFRASIEHHHRREDEVIWPLLGTREPGFADTSAELQHDHHELDHALVAVASAIGELADGRAERPDRLVVECHALGDRLNAHLDREEAAAFPLIARSFTAAEYHEIEAELRRGLTLAALAFEAPWILDGLPPAQADTLMEPVPVPLRLLNHLAFRPRYRRMSAVLTEESR